MKALLLASVAALVLLSAANAKPLTPKQVREYKALRSIGITKKDSRQVARDPGVKKGEWGWVCEGGGSSPIRVKGEGAKYRKNAVCE